jgi:hypothetical protein
MKRLWLSSVATSRERRSKNAGRTSTAVDIAVELLLLHTLALDQSEPLVLLLATPRPFRRDIDTVILLLLALLLGFVNCGGLVLGGRIHSVQDQGRRSRVDKLVLRACWNNYQVTGLDVLINSSDRGAASAGGEGQDLVDSMFLGHISESLRTRTRLN